MRSNITSIILAAGNGTRMLSEIPKVLHKIALQPILEYVLQTSQRVSDQAIVVINNNLPNNLDYIKLKEKYNFTDILQEKQLGTADAVKAAIGAVHTDYTLILYGDVPFVEVATLQKMQENVSDLVILGFEFNHPNQYGKIILDSDDVPCKIVEYKESQALERNYSLCNAGILMVKTNLLKDFLKELKNENHFNEYYLTDLIEFTYKHKSKYKIGLIITPNDDEVLGINDKTQLAHAEKILQKRLRSKLLNNGVIFLDPETVFLHSTTVLARDVVIYPSVFFGPDVSVDSGSTIFPFSHLEGVKIGKNCSIGPFARIRPTTIVESESRIGNFVEVKNSHISENTKASHLSYIGDVTIGDNTNVGAGAIFCNYDGRKKHRSVVGKNSFIGSNTSIISPVEIGDNVLIAAGSVINKDIPSNNIGISRIKQENKIKKS